MLRKTFVCISLTLFLLPVKGQVNITGIVLEQGKNTPIPYVHVWITGLPHGTSTNDDGAFEIKIPSALLQKDHTLSFSSIGFHTRKMPLEQLLGDDPVVVELVSSVTRMSELVIHTARTKRKNAAKARRLVQKALDRITKNYPKQPYLLNTFYRHYCSENENYVRLIEAAVDVYSPKNEFKIEGIPDDRLAFRIPQLRRSFDFTKNAKLFHPPISLNYLWSNDLTDFEYHNPLAGNLSQFNFKITDTTNYDQKTVFVVQFVEKEKNYYTAQTRYQGNLYIIEKSLAFIRTEVTEIKEKNSTLDSIRSEIEKISVYKAFNSRYYLDRLTNDVNAFHATMDSNRLVIDTLRHRSHIEMITNNIHGGDQDAFVGKEPQRVDLRKIKYDSLFWQAYTVLKATALEDKIIADLSEKISLQQQFEAFNTVEGGGISIIESENFRDLLSAHQGTPLYVVLWSNWGQLNYLDLKPINYFKRMLKKERMKLLLVAVENDADQWLNNRNYYGLNKRYMQHERLDLGFDSDITQSYFNNVFPYFICVTGDGTVLPDEPPLPTDDQLKPFLKTLIRLQ